MADAPSLAPSQLSSMTSVREIFTESITAKKWISLFTLSDYIIQNCKFPMFVSFLFMVYCAFQLLISAMWIPYQTDMKKSLEGLYIFAFWTQIDDFETSIPLQFIVYSVAFVISLALLVGSLFYLKSKRRMNIIACYCIRLLQEYFGLIVVHPLACFIGFMVVKLWNHGSETISIIIVLLSVVYFFYFAFFYYYFSGTSSYSAYIDNSMLMCFDSQLFRLFVLVNCILSFFAQIFNIFPLWTMVFLIIIHGIIVGLGLSRLLFMPFLKASSNVILLSVFTVMFLQDIIGLINCFFDKFPDGFIFLFTIIALIILLILFALYYAYIIPKFISILNYNEHTPDYKTEEENKVIMSDEMKFQRFDDIKYFTPKMIQFYLHYGLHFMTDMMLDMSLIKYLIHSEFPTHIIMNCLRYVILFPSETKFINNILIVLNKRRGLSTDDQFLLFQVRKIRLLRMSSSSIQATEKMQEIQQNEKICTNKITNFFSRKDANCGYLLNLYRNMSRTNSLFEESMKSFSNSTRYREEYIKFLIECETNFTGAILESHKKDLIESGVVLSVDYCYKAFIAAYPRYLKDKLLNTKGVMIYKNQHQGKNGSCSANGSTHHSHSGLMSSTENLDAKVEEEIGKAILTQAKVRIALQNATQSKKANTSRRMFMYLILDIVLAVCTFTVLYIILDSYFKDRYSATKRSMKCETALKYFTLSNLCSLVTWALYTGRLVIPTSIMMEWYRNEPMNISYLNPLLSYSENSLLYVYESTEMFEDLASDFSQYIMSSSDKEKVLKVALPLIENSVKVTLCHNGQPISKANYNLESALTYLTTKQAELASSTNFAQWFSASDTFCTNYGSNYSVENAMYAFRQSLYNDEIDTADSVEFTITLFLILLPTAVAIVCCIPFVVLTVLFIRETQRFEQQILEIEQAQLIIASKPIRRNAKDEEDDLGHSQEHYSNGSLYINVVIFLILAIAIIILVIVEILEAKNMNLKLKYIASWVLKSSIRSPFSLMALQGLFFSIFTTETALSAKTNLTNADQEKRILRYYMDAVLEDSEALIKGDDVAPGLEGFDSEILDMLVKSQCESETDSITTHESYRCLSVNSMFLTLNSMISDVIANILAYQGRIVDGYPIEITHLVMNHLLVNVEDINTKFEELVLRFLSEYGNIQIVFYVVELLIAFVCLAIGFLNLKQLDNSFAMALTLLRRISPIAIINKPKLLKYLLDITEGEEGAMSISESIVKNSQNGIFCLSSSGTIEIVNQAVSSIIGFTPDQMLGQAIDHLFDDDSANIVKQQLKLMLAGQASHIYEAHVTMINDNDMKIPCMMTLLGVEEDEKIISFVVVVNEESDLIKQQEDAEKAKVQSEKLLYEILPRDIVIRLNSGESDISFSVPSSTISFIDFVKFSEYSASLTPQEIMGNLSLLFGKFDENLAKHDLLMKIKLIGDVYMCAGGLFAAPETPPNVHAEQMVKFCLDVLSSVEDINVKLNTVLSVRIGVNTGGPLIAGVLGTDKPVFDIIGDPINVASRLQSTDIPGQVQISQSTYDSINHMDYAIECRGEVFLKGKGKQSAYLVTHAQVNAFQLSSETNLFTSQNNISNSNLHIE